MLAFNSPSELAVFLGLYKSQPERAFPDHFQTPTLWWYNAKNFCVFNVEVEARLVLKTIQIPLVFLSRIFTLAIFLSSGCSPRAISSKTFYKVGRRRPLRKYLKLASHNFNQCGFTKSDRSHSTNSRRLSNPIFFFEISCGSLRVLYFSVSALLFLYYTLYSGL